MPDAASKEQTFNCWLWALIEYWRRHRRWVQAGRVRGAEPYLLMRFSRREPRFLPHLLVGQHDPTIDAVLVDSFKPLLETDEPCWRAWRHMLFRGRVESGDTHRGDL